MKKIFAVVSALVVLGTAVSSAIAASGAQGTLLNSYCSQGREMNSPQSQGRERNGSIAVSDGMTIEGVELVGGQLIVR